MTEKLPDGCDPSLVNMPSFDSTVDINDQCTVNTKYLSQLEIEVTWGEWLHTLRGSYYMVAFTNVTKDGNPVGRLFISKEKFSQFESKLTVTDGKGTFKIDSTFQYGEANDAGKDRFLVFHDPGRISKIHQNRFVSAAFRKYGTMAAIVADQAPNMSTEQAIAYVYMIGDYLRVWKKEEETAR